MARTYVPPSASRPVAASPGPRLGRTASTAPPARPVRNRPGPVPPPQGAPINPTCARQLLLGLEHHAGPCASADDRRGATCWRRHRCCCGLVVPIELSLGDHVDSVLQNVVLHGHATEDPTYPSIQGLEVETPSPHTHCSAIQCDANARSE